MWSILFAITIGCVAQTVDGLNPEPDRTEATARTNRQPRARPTRAERLCGKIDPAVAHEVRSAAEKFTPPAHGAPTRGQAIRGVCKFLRKREAPATNACDSSDVRRYIVAVVSEELKRRKSRRRAAEENVQQEQKQDQAPAPDQPSTPSRPSNLIGPITNLFLLSLINAATMDHVTDANGDVASPGKTDAPAHSKKDTPAKWTLNEPKAECIKGFDGNSAYEMTSPTVFRSTACAPANLIAGCGGLGVKIMDIRLEKPRFMDTLSFNSREHRKVALVITISLLNITDDRLRHYRTWNDGTISIVSGGAVLIDNLGNQYRQVTGHALERLSGTSSKDVRTIRPQEQINDALAFEQPVERASKFSLVLPSRNIDCEAKLCLMFCRDDILAQDQAPAADPPSTPSQPPEKPERPVQDVASPLAGDADRLCAFMEASIVESLRECVTKLDPAGSYTAARSEAILSVRRNCEGGENKDPNVQRCLVAIVDEELKHRQSVIQKWPARPSRPGPGETPFERLRWLTTTMKRFLGEDKDNGPNGTKASPVQQNSHPHNLDCRSDAAAQLSAIPQ